MRVNIGPYPGPRSKKERVIKVKIDKCDTWSMDHTLSLIILPMLVQLKLTKHGSPMVEMEDVPENLRSEHATDPVTFETDAHWFERWDWVMDEMIWAFREHLDETAEDQFWEGEAHYLMQPVDKDHKPLGPPEERLSGITKKAPKGTVGWMMVQGPNHTLVHHKEAHQAYIDRKQNGFRLFGKYFTGLWD